MYAILSVSPGTCNVPGIKHGDVVKVHCAIDEAWHSEIKLTLNKLGEPVTSVIVDLDNHTGLIGSLTDLVTFNYTCTHHWKNNRIDPQDTPSVLPKVIVGIEHNGEMYVFENTTAKLLYFSPGLE